MDTDQSLEIRSREGHRRRVFAGLWALVLATACVTQVLRTEADDSAVTPLDAPHSWEVINIGNGFYQIRLKRADDVETKCLTGVPKQAAVVLLDCNTHPGAPSTARQWSFNRLTAGGYQVVSRWADFYGYPACLAATDKSLALIPCTPGVSGAQPPQDIAKLYADPTEPLTE
jgi:hypothetical protein